jgi:hypothetical protein
MELKDEVFAEDRDDQAKHKNQSINAYRVEEKRNLQQDDLERDLFISSSDKNKPVMEGKGAGGGNFGKNNVTPSGDDKNNPSRYGGYTNAYFARTEPSEEHPEDTNFKVQNQGGTPDYDKARPHDKITNETSYQEGTMYDDGINIPPRRNR